MNDEGVEIGMLKTKKKLRIFLVIHATQKIAFLGILQRCILPKPHGCNNNEDWLLNANYTKRIMVNESCNFTENLGYLLVRLYILATREDKFQIPAQVI